MSTTEENKAHYRRTFEEVFNQGNLALVDELVAPDFLNHEVPPVVPFCRPICISCASGTAKPSNTGRCEMIWA
jgi:hypothetical protein